MSDPTLKQADQFFKLGMAVHWLMPREKRPVEMGWSKGPKKNWVQLVKSYQPGFNIGVRLGEASKLKDGSYLAIIDCDCKSTDAAHRVEMEAQVRALLPTLDLSKTPTVMTGRGNGSCHLYVSAPKVFAPKTLARSKDRVRVKMPSAKEPSARDLKALTAEELGVGWRLRPAWEITFMCSPQQVAAPPSIHPDTGKPYRWKNGGLEKPLLKLPSEFSESLSVKWVGEEGVGGEHAATLKFEPVAVDLVGSSLGAPALDLILNGEGSSGDLSEDAYFAAIAMVRAGFSDAEIATVLTDPEAWISQAAYKRRGTNRASAADWVLKYRVAAARADAPRSPLVDFAGSPVVSEPGWETKIERTNRGEAKCTLKNVDLILSGVYGALFKNNLFSKVTVHGVDTPWVKAGSQVTDVSLSQLRLWLSQQWGIEPQNRMLLDVMNTIGMKHSFHPVRDYLNTLEWDGTQRIANWLQDYMGAEGPEEYLHAVSTKVLVAMVARVFQPGVKFDYVLIIEGAQGIGKSTLLRSLAGDEWFSDAALNIGDKDAVLAMRGAWLRELGELSGVSKAEVNQLKEFVSRTVDRIRVPYGTVTEEFPRESVYVATCNPHPNGYLRDKSGNRRFWPVHATRADFDRIRQDRDQLFAEAVCAWKLSEPLYIEDAAVNALAVREQEGRVQVDVLIEQIEKILKDQEEKEQPEFDANCFATTDILPLLELRSNPQDQGRLGEALAQLGFTRRGVRTTTGTRRRWQKMLPV